MTKPSTIKFGKMRVKIESKDSPTVYISPCGFTSKSFTRGKTTNEIPVPDCDDPDAPAWIESDVASLNWGISGEGVLANESVDTWDDAYFSTDSVNVQVEFEFTDRTIIYSGAAHLTQFDITSALGERIQANITIQGDGELVRSPIVT